MSNLCEFMPFRGIVYLSFWGRMLDLKLLFFFFFFWFGGVGKRYFIFVSNVTVKRVVDSC